MKTTSAEVIPLLRGAVKRLHRLERSELMTVYEQYSTARNEWLRRQIIENNRIDILQGVVLGYKVEPFHLAMMIWQFLHRRSLQLSFRGGGKTTTCSVVKAIHLLCKNRDLRILLGGESKTSAADTLREIKGHLENNERLIEIFGPFYDPKVVSKWDTTAIEVVGRTWQPKEPSIMCAGPDTTITGKHFEVGLCSDIVTEDNSRTEHMRERLWTWYYKTFRPMILPLHPEKEHQGEIHLDGTRYHFNDLYHYMQEHEMKEHTQTIPALDENDNSPWPEEYPPSYFKEQREELGLIIFSSQYQCDTEAMKGEIFQYDDCIELPDSDFPPLEQMRLYAGTDLSCDEEERKKNAMFAMALIGITGSISKNDIYIFLLDYFCAHLRPTRQPEKVLDFYDLHQPLRFGIETNQFQNYVAAVVKERRPQMTVTKIQTSKDKHTRAWKLAPYFEKHRFFFRKGVHAKAIEYLVRLPGGKWDFFDAVDNALTAAKKRNKQKRRSRKKFGVL